MGEVCSRSRGNLQRQQKTIVCRHEEQDKTKIRDYQNFRPKWKFSLDKGKISSNLEELL
jgi:hypothetical protein